MPQGFGFEARSIDRRGQQDRREVSDRRSQERRKQAGQVHPELRQTERRRAERRASGDKGRRRIGDRRSDVSRRSGGLRLTVAVPEEVESER
jgi:hypothetical protein